MIHQFPHAHPDELLLSLCVRYHQYAGYCSTSHTMTELFGHPRWFPTPDLPGHLGHLASELLAPRHTPEWLMTHYTLLPFYIPFQPLESREGMKRAMTTGISSAVYKYIGMTRYYRLQPETLQFCPTCCEEDTAQYGQAYWHRLHQVPGVLVCQTHKVFLESSRFPNRGGIRSQSFPPSHSAIPQTPPSPLDPENHIHGQLLRIAETAAWLLWKCRGFISIRCLQGRYQDALEDQNLIKKGRLDLETLEQRVAQHFSPQLLSCLRCELTDGGAKGWVAELLNTNGYGKHPLEHILMMNFLDIRPESLALTP